MKWEVYFSARGPGFQGATISFDYDPSPRDIARAFGFLEGTANFERVVNGGFTKARSSTVEHLLYTEKAAGSTPAVPNG